MPVSQARLQIVLEAIDEAKRTLDRAEKQIKGFGDETKKVGDKGEKASGKMGMLDGVMVGLGAQAANLITQLPSMAFEMVKLGAQAEAVSNRFTAFAGGTERANELLAAFQEGTDGTVSKMGAMEGAAKLLQMQLVDNAAEMELTAAIATRLGDQTMGAGDRIADFAALLANQSIPRLDNFGISSGRVRARIDELLKSGQALTRDAAFKMAVMEEGAKALDTLGDTSELAQTKMDKLAAAFEDAKVGLAEMATEMVSSAVDVDDLASRIRRLPETVDQLAMLAGAAFDAGEAFLHGRDAAEAFENSLRVELAPSIEYDKKVLDELQSTQAGLIPTFTDAEIAALALERRMRSIAIAELQWTETATAADYANELANMGVQAERAMVDLEDGINEVANASKTAVMSVDEYTAAIEAERAATEAAALAQMDLQARLMDASAAQIAQAAITQLKVAFDEGKITLDDYNLAVTETQLMFGLATPESIALAESILALTVAVADGEVKAKNFDTQLLMASNRIDHAKERADRLKDALHEIPQNIPVTVTVTTTGPIPTGGGGPQPYQHGTSFARGGLALVGEKGPELAWIPRGSQVYSAPDTARMLGGGGRRVQVTIVNNFGAGSVRSEEDIARISREIERRTVLRGSRVWEI